MNDNESEEAAADQAVVEEIATDEQPRAMVMEAEQLWRMAQKYHEAMAEDIPMPGDMIGVCAIMFTNLLIGGVMSGVDMAFVDNMLSMIKADVEGGVAHLQEQTMQ